MAIVSSEQEIGRRIRDAREAAGLSREKLAAEIGTSTSTITRLELEGRVPGALTLARIAARLDLSLDDLLAAQSAAS